MGRVCLVAARLAGIGRTRAYARVMDIVVDVVLGAVAFLAGIAIVVALVMGVLSPSRLKSEVDGLRPSKRSRRG